jgi:hypothetical protein
VWTAGEELKEDVLMYAARHTLCGVITHSNSESHIESKFHVNAEQGIVDTKILFPMSLA